MAQDVGHARVPALVNEMIVEWSSSALADLDRFAVFLQDRFPSLTSTIASALIEKSEQLRENPQLGRPVAGNAAFRQLTLYALRAAYVLQYEIHSNRIVILRIFHGREDRG